MTSRRIPEGVDRIEALDRVLYLLPVRHRWAGGVLALLLMGGLSLAGIFGGVVAAAMLAPSSLGPLPFVALALSGALSGGLVGARIGRRSFEALLQRLPPRWERVGFSQHGIIVGEQEVPFAAIRSVQIGAEPVLRLRDGSTLRVCSTQPEEIEGWLSRRLQEEIDARSVGLPSEVPAGLRALSQKQERSTPE